LYLLACVAASVGIGWVPAKAQDAPRIVVTSKPIHSLVQSVLGDVAKAELIVDGTASAHTYSLRPSDARLLNSANVVFRTSEALEPFTVRVARSLPKSVQLVTLVDAPGLKNLPMRKDANFEADKQNHGHGHGHAHGREKSVDPHVWLDPANAKAMIDHIATVLKPRFASSAAKLDENAARRKAEIDALAAELDRDLKPLAGRGYVVFHDAYQHFERRFGLTPVGAFVLNPETPPSGRRLADLRRRIGELGATCVFAEPNFDAKVVDTVIDGTKARKGVLDPEGASLPAGPQLYATLMRNLAGELRRCLAPQA
jgi:zinc transport system substrate-binding protein